MKITFIYAYEPIDEWSTPMALVNEFKSRQWDVEIISIGSNRTGIYTDVELKKWVDSKPKTDIVLFMDWGRFDSPYLDKKLVPAFWIQESGDDPQNFERNYPKANRFNLTITPDYDSYTEYVKRGINAEWITHFADTRVQFPIDIKPEYVAVTTRGRGGSQFLDQLTDWGEGAIGNKNGFDANQHTEFLNKGLMVIQNSRWGEITRRIFEAMACNKLVITDRLPENKKLHILFEENKEIVFYDSMQECIEKINYYHDNQEERNLIAKNGYEKVLNKFTQTQVVNRLLEKYYDAMGHN
jgi:glycosyltransferase involved in cell wall biosynthesis